jgi:hypothetical protein
MDQGDGWETLLRRMHDLPSGLYNLYMSMQQRLGSDEKLYGAEAALYFKCLLVAGHDVQTGMTPLALTWNLNSRICLSFIRRELDGDKIRQRNLDVDEILQRKDWSSSFHLTETSEKIFKRVNVCCAGLTDIEADSDTYEEGDIIVESSNEYEQRQILKDETGQDDDSETKDDPRILEDESEPEDDSGILKAEPDVKDGCEEGFFKGAKGLRVPFRTDGHFCELPDSNRVNRHCLKARFRFTHRSVKDLLLETKEGRAMRLLEFQGAESHPELQNLNYRALQVRALLSAMLVGVQSADAFPWVLSAINPGWDPTGPKTLI